MAEAKRTEDGPLRIGVICEAPADFRIGTCLADRVLYRDLDWLAPEIANHVRRWCGPYDSEHVDPFLRWDKVDDLNAARDRPLRLLGRFDGRKGAADARRARLALELLRSLGIRHVVMLRDADHQADERREGLEQARQTANQAMNAIVIGLAVTKRECWVLSGFESQDDDEQERLDALRRELGYDPTATPERLTAARQGRHQAKPVLEQLVDGDHEREARCWTEPTLERLRDRGRNNGLTAFLDEVAERLVPCLEDDA